MIIKEAMKITMCQILYVHRLATWNTNSMTFVLPTLSAVGEAIGRHVNSVNCNI